MKMYGFQSILMLILVCTGCASTPRTIPTGQWAGTGTYAEYKVTDQSETVAKGNTYSTTLEISERTLYGHSALYFEIASKRGKLMSMEDEETRLAFIIVKVKTLSSEVDLYALIDFSFNRPAKEISEQQFKERLEVPSASCIRRNEALILHVLYLKGFWDTFSFESGTIRKMGRVIQIKSKDDEPSEDKFLFVDWAEELQRIK